MVNTNFIKCLLSDGAISSNLAEKLITIIPQLPHNKIDLIQIITIKKSNPSYMLFTDGSNVTFTNGSQVIW